MNITELLKNRTKIKMANDYDSDFYSIIPRKYTLDEIKFICKYYNETLRGIKREWKSAHFEDVIDYRGKRTYLVFVYDDNKKIYKNFKYLGY